MNKNEREQVVHFTATASKCGFTFSQIARMLAIAKTANHLNEVACNTGLTDRQQTRADNLDNEMREICNAAGLTVYCNGDPRGWPYRINADEAGRAVDQSKPVFGVPDKS